MSPTFWLVLLIVTIILFFITLFKKIRPRWKKFAILLTTLVASLVLAFKYLIPLNPAFQPSGNETVNVSNIYLTHPTAIPGMETNGDNREIPIKIWAPENLENKQHPILIFSHGSFGVAESNESLFLELASQSYIVVSLSHPHHSFFADMSDGSTIFVNPTFFNEVMQSQGANDLEATIESAQNWISIRLEDLNYVIDSILNQTFDHEITQAIDPNQIILAGHSLGGSAVLAIGRSRPETIQAVISLEAPFFADIIGIEGDEYVFTHEIYPVPILHIYSDALWGRLDDITTYEMNQRLINLDSPEFVNYHVEGSGHIGLTDMSLVSPIITNLLDGGLNTKPAEDKLLEINHQVLDFLNKYRSN